MQLNQIVFNLVNLPKNLFTTKIFYCNLCVAEVSLMGGKKFLHIFCKAIKGGELTVRGCYSKHTNENNHKYLLGANVHR